MAIEDAIAAAKDKLPDITPTPPAFHSQATAHELKSRLNWGEPGLTILDVRSHEAFGDRRIMGAMNMQLDELPQAAQSLASNRDIYVYGENDEESATAATRLRDAGFVKVAELKGGLAAWQEIDGSVEGIATNENPGSDAYNVGSRLTAFSQEKEKEQRMEQQK
ncbi:MAG: rhodanese-like domain-containing protein [Drouetiella hepatica Uher 2000/2452]|jgi:rhodanese-related sulfurtransferase|uniref:Rhodanese-like domain-containing protein n=1 Tax=Drouetiella hepatica Uher 2000/2452 TaxID=904376 RepID=A0A951UN08_9CYAN|nr:rhodanese-like domain-containing protein [Drouetiella hepatica Uher 2000/2452]